MVRQVSESLKFPERHQLYLPTGTGERIRDVAARRGMKRQEWTRAVIAEALTTQENEVAAIIHILDSGVRAYIPSADNTYRTMCNEFKKGYLCMTAEEYSEMTELPRLRQYLALNLCQKCRTELPDTYDRTPRVT